MLSARFVSIASAGTNGYAYYGFLDALEAHCPDYDAWRRDLQGVAGCSAGCICALGLVLGLSREMRAEIEHFFDISSVVPAIDLARLVKKYGADDGARMREAVERTLAHGGLSPHTTLGDLKRLLRVEFVCVCTDLQTSRPVSLSSSTTPHVRVTDAIYASCAIPFVFCPHRIDALVLVDGCMTCTQPNPFVESETLFVSVSVPLPGEIQDWQDFLARIVQCCSMRDQDDVAALYERNREQSILLELPTTTSFDIDMDATTRDMIRACGYRCTLDFLQPRVQRVLRECVATYVHSRLIRMEPDAEEEPPSDGGSYASAPVEE